MTVREFAEVVGAAADSCAVLLAAAYAGRLDEDIAQTIVDSLGEAPRNLAAWEGWARERVPHPEAASEEAASEPQPGPQPEPQPKA